MTTNTNNEVKFPIGKCESCGHSGVEIMISNNPLIFAHVCFECIKSKLNYRNLSHADFFCRTFNLVFNPELWITLSQQFGDNVFKQYTKVILEDTTLQPNLYYHSSTQDLWSKANKEWEKCRSFTEILQKLKPIKESYTIRGQLKWGDQYSFQDLIRLDSIYTRTLKANNITNPMQKEAVKTLCKLQLQLDDCIKAGDSKGIRDYSSAWGTFAKQADLENMIAETKTSDITTVAEVGDYLEKTGFVPSYDVSVSRDEVDQAINDIQQSLRKTILESTSIQPLLESLIKKQQESLEDQKTKQATSDVSLQDLMNFTPDQTAEVETEADSDVQDLDFSSESINDKLLQQPIKVSHKETAELTTMPIKGDKS